MDYSCLAVPTEVGYRYPESGAGAVMSRPANLGNSCSSVREVPGPSAAQEENRPEAEQETRKLGTVSPELIPDTTELEGFMRHWFAHDSDKDNMFQLVAACKYTVASWLGMSEGTFNISVVYVQSVLDDVAITSKNTAVDELGVHEIGHQFVVTQGHVDTQQQVNNHEGSDYCIMTYATDIDDGEAEFCEDHLNEIRDDADPR